MNNGDDERFVSEVRRQAERQAQGRATGFWYGLGLMGAVGWMVSLPAVGGALLGYWIDRRYGLGVFWTLTLLLTGVAVGSASAWRHVRKELNS